MGRTAKKAFKGAATCVPYNVDTLLRGPVSYILLKCKTLCSVVVLVRYVWVLPHKIRTIRLCFINSTNLHWKSQLAS